MTTVLLPWEKMKSERKFLRFSTSASVYHGFGPAYDLYSQNDA